MRGGGWGEEGAMEPKPHVNGKGGMGKKKKKVGSKNVNHCPKVAKDPERFKKQKQAINQAKHSAVVQCMRARALSSGYTWLFLPSPLAAYHCIYTVLYILQNKTLAFFYFRGS